MDRTLLTATGSVQRAAMATPTTTIEAATMSARAPRRDTPSIGSWFAAILRGEPVLQTVTAP